MLAGLGIILVALNLRAPVVAISPVLHELQRSTGLSNAEAGLLTTLPVAFFGLAGPLAIALARRYSMELLLFCAMAVLTAAMLLRLIPTEIALFGGTLLAGIMIAVGNVLLPSVIKRDFGARTGTMTAAYVAALSLGAAFAAGLTVPLEHLFGWDWRRAIAIWGVFAAAATMMWLPQLWSRHRIDDARPRIGLRTLVRDPVAWHVTAFMGLQSFGFYTTTAWLPALFVGQGIAPSEAGWLLSLTNILGVPAVLAAPILSAKLHDQRPLVMVVVAVYAAAIAGLLVAPTVAPFLWAALLGTAQGATFSLAIAFILLRAPDAAHTAPLSTMAQGVGYLMAACGPFVFGALRDATHGWTVPLLALFLLFIPMTTSGIGAARPRFVGRDRSPRSSATAS
jgi:MFS transporter, CP family, cyanate transporter